MKITVILVIGVLCSLQLAFAEIEHPEITVTNNSLNGETSHPGVRILVTELMRKEVPDHQKISSVTIRVEVENETTSADLYVLDENGGFVAKVPIESTSSKNEFCYEFNVKTAFLQSSKIRLRMSESKIFDIKLTSRERATKD